MIDWGAASFHGVWHATKAHAIIDGEAACGTYGLYQDSWRIVVTLPASERPHAPEHNFNSVCKRCDAYVMREM